MKTKNYFQIHKNKKPKKLRYSSFYTSTQKQKMRECYHYFVEQIELRKNGETNF